MAEGLVVKPIPAITWADTNDREAALIRSAWRATNKPVPTSWRVASTHGVPVALHLLADHNEALDLSQEVFLQVFRTLPRFRAQSSLRTWIYRIVVNQAKNRQRWWRRRHRAAQVSLDEHVLAHGELPANGNGISPDRVFGQRELAARLKDALLGLPFDQRTAIVLREIDGLSYEEIAFSQGVAVGTVKSRLARAREILRAELRQL